MTEKIKNKKKEKVDIIEIDNQINPETKYILQAFIFEI